MKLIIRPLGKPGFEVEAEPSETIHDLKLRISERGFPVEAQNLLNTGKSLQDDKTIGSYSIKEASTLVLMTRTAAAVSPSASMSNSPRTALGTFSTPPLTAPIPAQTASASRLPIPSLAYAMQATAPPVATSSTHKAVSEMAQGPAFSGTGIYSNVGPSQSNIDKITNMGFSRDQAVRALRASFDNVGQALDLLVNDPDNIGAEPPRAPNSLVNVPGLPNGAPHQTSGLPQSLVPRNLMTMVAQQQQQQELPDLSSMSLGALGGLGGAGASSGSGSGSGAATAEVSAEQIEEIRRLVAYNPILTGPLLEQIKREDPELYRYIDNDPEKLLHALSQGGDDSGPSVSPPPASFLPPTLPPAPGPVPQRVTQPTTETQTMSVTREEHQAIEEIVRMGFERQTVLQAYFACDRNAERAVEFLLAGAF